jgi:hypothetical protein
MDALKSKRVGRITVELPSDVTEHLRRLAARFPHARAHALGVEAARLGVVALERQLVEAARDVVAHADAEVGP